MRHAYALFPASRMLQHSVFSFPVLPLDLSSSFFGFRFGYTFALQLSFSVSFLNFRMRFWSHLEEKRMHLPLYIERFAIFVINHYSSSNSDV